MENHCRLCGKCDGLSPAGFRQSYRQIDGPTKYLNWWECAFCRGWFLCPVPTPAEIESHCKRAYYNDPGQAVAIAAGKQSLHTRLLTHLAERTAPGALLDIGCSFGEFMVLARTAGWTPSGFDPYGPAVKEASGKGFDVRCEWILEKACFPRSHFSAVTVIDSFCYAWHPYETLRTIHDLLRPGGTLAMRITNKLWLLKWLRRLIPPGVTRDARLSRVLKGQYHAISMGHLENILKQIGFESVTVLPQATTAAWGDLSTGTKWAYMITQLIHAGSAGTIQLSPGTLLLATKSVTGSIP